MGIIDALRNDTQQVEAKIEEVIEPQAPALPQEPEKPAVDRSAFNCPVCGGSGLIDPYTICDRCAGTGKV